MTVQAADMDQLLQAYVAENMEAVSKGGPSEGARVRGKAGAASFNAAAAKVKELATNGGAASGGK